MFNMDALTAVKLVASGVVGIGTGKIVKGFIKANTTPETLIDKVTIAGAAWAMSGMAAAATKQYTDESIDTVVRVVAQVRDYVKTVEKLGRINAGHSTFAEEGLDQSEFHQQDGKWYKTETEIKI